MDQGMRFLLVEPEKKIALTLGYTVRGIAFKRRDDRWLMVITVITQRAEHLVAFITADTIYDCWWYLNEHLTKTNAPLKWREDKYRR